MASSSPDDVVNMDVLTKYLSKDDLSKMAPIWIRIGMGLGQEACVRELLKTKDTPPNDCVAAVLQKWVESCKDVSWAKLCSVLHSLELKEIAEQIQQVRLRFGYS